MNSIGITPETFAGNKYLASRELSPDFAASAGESCKSEVSAIIYTHGSRNWGRVLHYDNV